MSTNGLSTAAVGTLWRTLSGSLALITGRVSATELEHGIRDKYSERPELDTARQQASLGLTEGWLDKLDQEALSLSVTARHLVS